MYMYMYIIECRANPTTLVLNARHLPFAGLGLLEQTLGWIPHGCTTFIIVPIDQKGTACSIATCITKILHHTTRIMVHENGTCKMIIHAYWIIINLS